MAFTVPLQGVRTHSGRGEQTQFLWVSGSSILAVTRDRREQTEGNG